MAVSRRAFLAGAALAAALPAVRRARAASGGVRLEAAPQRLNLVGAAYPDTEAWAFNGTTPGPVLRAPQGATLRVEFVNRLPEESTIHWHGIRLPNAMDGVPHLTQPPVPPGGRFQYAFRLPDAGTFWYHPHAHSAGQLGRGLYGALVVEEPDPPPCDRDVVWVLADFRLDREARIRPEFDDRFDASHAGRIGNTVTVNGRVAEQFALRAGERVRLRLVNAANARIFRLAFEGHAPVVIALDGHPVEPYLAGSGLVLAPGMRADLMLDATGRPGARFRVLDDWYRNGATRLLDLAYEETPLRAAPLEQPVRALPPNPVPEPELARAERLSLVLGGGAKSPELRRASAEERLAIANRMRAGRIWSLNGESPTGHGAHAHAPLFRLVRGRSYALEVRNDTAWHHPVHLHGVAFRVVGDTRGGWRDTLLVAPGEQQVIAFVADNPGDWMIHCHILEHQAAGMMATMRID